jgi:hypothetical protein
MYSPKKRKRQKHPYHHSKGKIEIGCGGGRTCPPFAPVHIGKKFPGYGSIKNDQSKHRKETEEKTAPESFSPEKERRQEKEGNSPQRSKIGRNGTHRKNTEDKVEKIIPLPVLLYDTFRRKKCSRNKEEGDHIAADTGGKKDESSAYADCSAGNGTGQNTAFFLEFFRKKNSCRNGKSKGYHPVKERHAEIFPGKESNKKSP